MAGSGGGTSQGLADYQQDFHNLMMVGMTVDDSPKTWDNTAADPVYHASGTYSSYPSVARFIIDKGLTDVGGNPFEGVSTFDPGEALGVMNDSFDDYMEKVDGIDYSDDWTNNLASAQAEQSGQVPELDVGSVFSDIIGDSLARAFQLSTQAYSTAKSDSENVMDSIVERSDLSASGVMGTAEAEADSSSSALSNSARVEAAEGMADARTSFGLTEADAQTDIDDVFSDAVSKALEKAESIKGEEGDNVRSSMSSTSEQAKSDTTELIAEATSEAQTNADSMIGQFDTKITKAGGYAEVAGDNVVSRTVTDSREGISSIAEAASVKADADSRSVLDAVDSLVGATGAKGETLSDNIYTDAEDDSKTAMTSVSADTTSAKQAMADFATKVDTEVQTDIQDVSTDALEVAGDTQGDALTRSESIATTTATNAEVAIRSSVKEAMADIMSGATPDVVPLIQASIQDALNGAQTAVLMAIDTAESIVDSAPIAKAVAAYRRRALTEHLRTVNRFAGGMADINAVNSSAFIIGMALQESSFDDKVMDYQAGIEGKLFADAFPVYIDTFKNAMAAYLRSYEAQQAHMVQIALSSTTTTTQLFITSFNQCIETYMRGFVDYIGLYKDVRRDTMGAGIQLAGIQSQILQASAGLRQSMVNTLSRVLMEVYVQVLTSQIDAEVGMIRDVVSLRQRLMSDIGKVYADSYGENLSSHMGSSTGMARAGFESATQTGESKVAITKDLMDTYLRTYVDLIAQQGANANVFSGLGKDKIQAFKDMLVSKLDTFSRVVDKELQTFDRGFANHMQSAGETMRDHFRGTIDSRLEEKREKLSFVNTHTSLLNSMDAREIESHRAATTLLSNLQKTTIIARGEEYEKNLEYDSLAATWDLELFQMGGNVLSAVTGSVLKAGKPSRAQSTLAGMASGAGMGMEIGAMIPGAGPLAAPIGGAIGALTGAIAGYQP